MTKSVFLFILIFVFLLYGHKIQPKNVLGFSSETHMTQLQLWISLTRTVKSCYNTKVNNLRMDGRLL